MYGAGKGSIKQHASKNPSSKRHLSKAASKHSKQLVSDRQRGEHAPASTKMSEYDRVLFSQATLSKLPSMSQALMCAVSVCMQAASVPRVYACVVNIVCSWGGIFLPLQCIHSPTETGSTCVLLV